MKNILFGIFISVLGFGSLMAQDEAIFNHYVQSPIILNPAAAGFNEAYTFQLNARSAWTGFDDSPKTVALRMNAPIGQSFGLGAAVFSESAAQQKRLKGQLDVAFRFSFGNDVKGEPAFKAGFGFYSQFQRLSIDADILNNPVYQPGDDDLIKYLDGKNQFDAGVGFFGSYMDKTFGGLTINNLVSNRLDNISGSNNEETINYTFLLGHHFYLEDLNVNLTPSIMMRNIQYAPFMMDLNLQAGFLDDRFIAGLSYRYLGAMGMLLGTRINGFQLFYNYDLSFGDFQSYNSGSHELTIGYTLSRADIAAAQQRKIQAEKNQ